MWVGAKPGVYTSWDECKEQIQGYPAAKYKSFESMAEANKAYASNPSTYIGLSSKPKVIKTTGDRSGIIWDSISVDAACSGSPGTMEYRGVWTKDGTQIFHRGPYEYGTNNVGEFLALVHGIAWLKQQGMDHVPIYSDSRTAMAWLRNKKTKSTLERKKINEGLYELFDRAEAWIKSNSWSNPVHKWETKKWGEIPADFGRK